MNEGKSRLYHNGCFMHNYFICIALGFSIQTSAYITDDYIVSEDGNKITFKADVGSSMGYLRGYTDKGGGDPI